MKRMSLSLQMRSEDEPRPDSGERSSAPAASWSLSLVTILLRDGDVGGEFM